jgi:hypothetical protein
MPTGRRNTVRAGPAASDNARGPSPAKRLRPRLVGPRHPTPAPGPAPEGSRRSICGPGPLVIRRCRRRRIRPRDARRPRTGRRRRIRRACDEHGSRRRPIPRQPRGSRRAPTAYRLAGKRVTPGPQRRRPTVSAGAGQHEPRRSAEQSVRCGDRSVYQAKNAGRCRPVRCSKPSL